MRSHPLPNKIWAHCRHDETSFVRLEFPTRTTHKVNPEDRHKVNPEDRRRQNRDILSQQTRIVRPNHVSMRSHFLPKKIWAHCRHDGTRSVRLEFPTRTTHKKNPEDRRRPNRHILSRQTRIVRPNNVSMRSHPPPNKIWAHCPTMTSREALTRARWYHKGQRKYLGR
jgi:hypothetical protein